jgi:hypothetical protein
LHGRIAYDATKYIGDSGHEVLKKTLSETLLIVSVVVFLFLAGPFRSVLIPLAAIPLSLIGGVFSMQSFGFSLNLLTLLAVGAVGRAGQWTTLLWWWKTSNAMRAKARLRSTPPSLARANWLGRSSP